MMMKVSARGAVRRESILAGRGLPVPTAAVGGASLPPPRPVCYDAAMRRFLTMLRVMLVAVLLWTGSAAHAAEAVNCDTVASACTGDVGGGEEAPGDADECLCHHGSCHGHCATLASTPSEPRHHSVRSQHAWNRALFDAGDGPDQVSRPPIA
jgi:hypothetical protein